MQTCFVDVTTSIIEVVNTISDVTICDLVCLHVVFIVKIIVVESNSSLDKSINKIIKF
jgi:hypothetical protein